ncbi:MAG: pitrilysin family protein [Verrucomicrobiales bacterium]
MVENGFPLRQILSRAPLMPTDIRIHQLDNGLRLATVAMPHMASVSVGLWTGAGSRHERPAEHGLAHFVEHMLFKGTPTRTAEDISRHIEGLGATIDGFTVEDYTAYHAQGPADQFDRLFDVLADFYRNATLDGAEIESEKQVIHEEISMVRDQPSQHLEDLLSEAAWGKDHPLGRSITGTENSLDAFQRDDVLGFFRRAYCGANTVVSIAGNIDSDAVLDSVASRFAGIPAGSRIAFTPASEPSSRHLFERETDHEQDHLALSFRSVDRHHPDRFAHRVLDAILGGNMSSRLFQKIREQLGLCYEVQSDIVSFSDAGLLQIYLALSPENLKEALEGVSNVLENLRKNTVSDAELAGAKAYLVGQSRISLENTAAQMMWAGESLLFFDDWLDPEEAHRKIQGVTAGDVRDAARAIFDTEAISSALIGRSKSNSVLEDWISAPV